MIINILIIIQGNMDYKIFELESPIDKDSFDEFTKKEASIYFEWYMSVIDKRIKYLENYINTYLDILSITFISFSSYLYSLMLNYYHVRD